MLKYLEAAILTCLVAAPVIAEPLGIGRPALPEEVAAWDIDVRPDGLGLPEGSGSVEDGEVLFTDQCSSCHGVFGEGTGRWPVLAGGFDSLESDRPVKTIGSYWPYLSTVFDYVHRAMPFGNAQSLSDDEVYAITAYLLYLNDQVDEEFTLSSDNFTEISFPNEDSFFPDDRLTEEAPLFSETFCMEACKDDVKITMRARVLDVTPDGGGVTEDGVVVASADTTDKTSEAAEIEPADMAIDADLAAAGENAFRQCKSCHQIGEGAKNRSGPQLNGVVGRAAGGVEGFRYSNAMQDAAEDGLIWSPETLAEFLEEPKSFLKGTKMSFRGFKDEADAAAVIEYLKTFSSPEG